jgi:archaellum component FlaD/FlaE
MVEKLKQCTDQMVCVRFARPSISPQRLEQCLQEAHDRKMAAAAAAEKEKEEEEAAKAAAAKEKEEEEEKAARDEEDDDDDDEESDEESDVEDDDDDDDDEGRVEEEETSKVRRLKVNVLSTNQGSSTGRGNNRRRQNKSVPLQQGQWI